MAALQSVLSIFCEIVGRLRGKIPSFYCVYLRVCARFNTDACACILTVFANTITNIYGYLYYVYTQLFVRPILANNFSPLFDV